jgi:hypothetical protein
VRVEDEPELTVDALVEFADVALAGLAHRRLEFDLTDAGDPLRAAFEARGWQAQRVAWMRHEAAWPTGTPNVRAERVDYDAARPLRVAWHYEETPDLEPAAFFAQARDIALRRGAQTFAVREGRTPVAFVELACNGSDAEVTHAYATRAPRSRARGGADPSGRRSRR